MVQGLSPGHAVEMLSNAVKMTKFELILDLGTFSMGPLLNFFKVLDTSTNS